MGISIGGGKWLSRRKRYGVNAHVGLDCIELLVIQHEKHPVKQVVLDRDEIRGLRDYLNEHADGIEGMTIHETIEQANG